MEDINKIIQNEIITVFSNSFNDIKIIKKYCLLKWIYMNNKLKDLFPSIKNLIYYNLSEENNNILTNYLNSNDIENNFNDNNFENNFNDNNLYNLCIKYLDDINKPYDIIRKEWIKKFIDEDFVIFPVHLDKTPMCYKWNNLTQTNTKEIYNNNPINIKNNDNNYRLRRQLSNKNNIGLLCGIQSLVVVLDIDIKDNGMTYWNNLLKEYNNSEDINTLKTITGSKGYHYFFTYENKMKKWWSANRLFSTDDNKIGIDFRTNNGYVVLPPSIHSDTAELYKFNINTNDNIRKKIINMPEWLYFQLDKWFKYLNKNNKFILFKSVNINSYDMCYNLIKNNICSLKNIPEKYKTLEICEISILNNSLSLQYVPNNLRTYDLCIKSVIKNSYSLEYVPEKLKDINICMIAINRNGFTIKFVPETLITLDICKLVISKYPSTIKYISNNLINLDLCKIAINKDPYVLEYIPDEFKSFDICMELVSQNGELLEFVPYNIKTYEMCTIAVLNYGLALLYVPIKYKTYELCLYAVSNKGFTLAYVPIEYKSLEICLKAVINNGNALAYVPENHKTINICIKAVANNINAIHYISERFVTLQQRQNIIRLRKSITTDVYRIGIQYTEQEFNIASIALRYCYNNRYSYLLGLCFLFPLRRARNILNVIVDG
jgi:hypothetical protein